MDDAGIGWWTSEAAPEGELERADVNYAELATRIPKMGLSETHGSVTVKIIRGAFPVWILLAVRRVIGAYTLRLEEWS